MWDMETILFYSNSNSDPGKSATNPYAVSTR